MKKSKSNLKKFINKILPDYGRKRRLIKCGKLYFFPLDCPDIEKGLLRRIFRRMNIPYIPFMLRFYDRLFLREDKSRFNRVLVDYCKKRGIETYVVQEGASKAGAHGHLPLRADIFLCPPDAYDWWIEQGMPKDRIRVFHPQKVEYNGIVFLAPFFTKEDILHFHYWDNTNTKTIELINRFMKEDVVFKLHRKNADLVARFIPFNRIVTGEAEDLIMKYDTIYCSSGSTIVDDCKSLGKKAIEL